MTAREQLAEVLYQHGVFDAVRIVDVLLDPEVRRLVTEAVEVP